MLNPTIKRKDQGGELEKLFSSELPNTFRSKVRIYALPFRGALAGGSVALGGLPSRHRVSPSGRSGPRHLVWGDPDRQPSRSGGSARLGIGSRIIKYIIWGFGSGLYGWPAHLLCARARRPVLNTNDVLQLHFRCARPHDTDVLHEKQSRGLRASRQLGWQGTRVPGGEGAGPNRDVADL